MPKSCPSFWRRASYLWENTNTTARSCNFSRDITPLAVSPTAFRRTYDVAEHGLAEYKEHLAIERFSQDTANLANNLDALKALAAMVEADRIYLAVLAADAALMPLAESMPGQTRGQLMEKAKASY